MRNRFRTTLKKFIPPLVVIFLLPIVIALLFLPESFLYIPPEGFSTEMYTAIAVGLVLVFFGVSIIGKKQLRNNDPIAQKLLILIIAPALIGLVLSFIYGNPLLLLSGVALTYLVVAWINILRFPVRFWVVMRFVRRNNYTKALQLLSSWTQTHPNDWKAFQLRAELYFNQLQLVNAERDTQTAIKLQPTPQHEDFFRLCQILHLQSLYMDAKQAILTALAIKPNPAYYFSLGIECYRLEQYPEAIEALQKATRSTLALLISNLLANYYLGRSFEITGNSEQANRYYRNLPKYSHKLEEHMEQISQLPDYREVICMRADYDDIKHRLSEQ